MSAATNTAPGPLVVSTRNPRYFTVTSGERAGQAVAHRPSSSRTSPDGWSPLAGGAGYFDQAHFGHEFRAFTGLTPTRYVEVRRRFLREHPGHALDGWPLPAD